MEAEGREELGVKEVVWEGYRRGRGKGMVRGRAGDRRGKGKVSSYFSAPKGLSPEHFI